MPNQTEMMKYAYMGPKYSVGARDINIYLSRDRFESIHKHACLNTWESWIMHPYKKFWKTLTKIINKSTDMIHKPKVFSIDEFRVIATSHKDGLKSWNRGKPIKLGRDIYNVCCAGQRFHGLTLLSLPYAQNFTYDDDLKVDDDEGLQDNKIHQLIFENNDTSDEIYVMDRGFTSVYIATKISEKFGGIGIIGTVKSNSKCLPKKYLRSKAFQAEFKRWQKGDHETWMCSENNITLTILKDSSKSPVLILDNCIHPWAKGKMMRKGVEYDIPFAGQFYNEHMGEVDASASHRKCFAIDRKSVRYNQRTLWGLVELYALINPSILMAEKENRSEIPHLLYRTQLIETWTTGYREWLKARQESIVGNHHPCDDKTRVHNTITYLGDRVGYHIQVPLHPTDRRKQRRCRQCRLNDQVNFASCVCSCCSPCLPLCKPSTGRNCFVDYHSNHYPDNDRHIVMPKHD